MQSTYLFKINKDNYSNFINHLNKKCTDYHYKYDISTTLKDTTYNITLLFIETNKSHIINDQYLCLIQEVFSQKYIYDII